MRVASGKAINSRVVLDGHLPEGAEVTVLAPEHDETFEADPETEKMLLESMAQGGRGETIPLSGLLEELRGRERGCLYKSRSANSQRGKSVKLKHGGESTGRKPPNAIREELDCGASLIALQLRLAARVATLV